MKTTAPIAKSAATPRTGFFATLRGLLHDQGSGAPARTRLAFPAVLVTALAATSACAGAFAASALGTEACPNEQIREEQGSTRLPECRAYEMVSPIFKGGYGASAIDAFASNGESLAFNSEGAYDGDLSNAQFTTYVSHRDVSGWSTAPLLPPASIAPYLDGEGPPVQDFSSTLETYLVRTSLGSSYGDTNDESEHEFLLHSTSAPDTAANFALAGQILTSPIKEPTAVQYGGASPDLSHILLVGYSAEAGGTGKGAGALLPGALGAPGQLYELVASGEGAPSLQIVALNNSGELIDPYCEPALGAGGAGSISPRQSGFNAIADNGTEIFFTDNANRNDKEGSQCDGTQLNNMTPENPALLFVRVNGEKTLKVSAPVAANCVAPAPCAGALPARAAFEGANEAGTKVFFTTDQPLVSADTDSSNDLYMASISCPGGGETCEPAAREVSSMVQVSHDPHSGQAAEVQGVVSVSPDGSRVYFVARGVLSEAPNAQGDTPALGADNLYEYDSTTAGSPAFIADLCSEAELSGIVKDTRCPDNLLNEHDTSPNPSERNDTQLWLAHTPEAQTAGADGGFLLFSSYGQLVGGDTDTAKDVYRYDAETGALVRVSVGDDGYDANGNSSLCNGGETTCNATLNIENVFGGAEAAAAEMARLDKRAITEDGSRVVFTTAEALSPDAVNGLNNVYEWHESRGDGGVVSLVSTGAATEPINDAVITPEGRDIFFVTTQGLVPQDTDGQEDVYDARIDGGFPPVSASAQPCSGDACQGPLTNPVPLLVPGSVSQVPGGNFAKPVAATTAKPKPKSKPRKCKKDYVKKKGRCVKKPKAKKTANKRRVKS